MMPDDAKTAAPINASHDFQLGVLFARQDAADSRMDVMEGRIAGLTSDIHRVKDDVVREVKQALDDQTKQLTPIITEKMVRDTNLAAAKARSENNTNFWMRAGAIIGVCSTLATGLIFVAHTWWTPANPLHVVTVPPSVTHSSP